MDTIDGNITRFTKHFRDHVNRIEQITVSNDAEVDLSLYQKTLYIAVLDALSKAVYPQRGNRERMVTFITQFSEWLECNRVSLPHLVQLLAKTPEPAFERLRAFTFSEIAKWNVPRHRIISLSDDPSLDDIQKLWPRQQEYRQPLNRVGMESLQHSHLFYAFRNRLVHELQQSGRGMEELGFNDGPSYHHLGMENGTESWELVYPVGFFKKICDKSLDNLESYLRRNRLDPMSLFKSGSYWIDELND